MIDENLISAGELRCDFLQLFNPETPTSIMVSAPAHVGKFPTMEDIHAEPHKAIGRSSAYAFRKAIFAVLAREIDNLEQTEFWSDTILRWCTALNTGTVRCFQFIQHPLFTRLISKKDCTVVQSGPFTLELAKMQRELVIELTGKEHEKARQWFQTSVQKCENISGHLKTLLENSWAGPLLSPKELYYKILTEYFWTTIEGLDLKADDNPLLAQLTEFQLEAYQYAKGILRRYGGVFLADVVGLGKTFIALALLRHLQDRYGEHAVVVAPPNVLPAWRQLAAEFRVELQFVSIGKLDDLDKYKDREVLVVDESHNFRNTGTQRYDRIQDWLRPGGAASSRKVLLLSATPQNNRPEDVKHQLAFFPDNYTRLPFRGESLDGWFKKVRHKQASLTELLQHIVVRRTRRFIKSAYPDATLRIRDEQGKYKHVPLQFPDRRSGPDQCLRYSINETYGRNLYEGILEALANLLYVPYCLAGYLTESGREDDRVAGIRRAGTSIRGLFKVLLLKRLESSVVAFRNTLVHLKSRLEESQRRLEQGVVLVRISKEQTVSEDDELTHLVHTERSVPVSLFDSERLATDLRSDYEEVCLLLTRVESIEQRPDKKFERLCKHFEENSPREHRTVVFTQFADTAEYLFENLAQRYGRTQVVTGNRGNALKAARRFSPRANRIEIREADQLDLLISTDALSEGVNLQDADTLINYDIHWNPVRLIQRAGRIDRIGSENDIITVASFLPEAALESALGLESVLRERIAEFLKVFGEDSHILPSEDQLDLPAAVAAYTGEAFEEEDDDMDGLSRHVERLLQIRRNNPTFYNHVLELRTARHAASQSKQVPVCCARLDWFWRFWIKDHYGAIQTVDDLRGLDIFYNHTEMEPCENSPGSLRNALGHLISSVREEFEPLANSFREQRLNPRLTPPETFVLERLEEYGRNCIASRKAHVEELISWTRRGYAQVRLRQFGKIWKREALPAETVFQETRLLFTRFPPNDNEQFGRIEVLGAVMGSLPSSD